MLRMSIAVFLLITCAGCGSDEPQPTSESALVEAASTTDSEPAGLGLEDDGLVSPAAIAACGGFTLEDAASVLGVPASQLEDRSEGYSDALVLCSFMMSNSADGLGFYLSVSGSVERAIAEMEQGRGMAGVARETIDQVTGTESEGEALESAEGIGEEAYFMEINGTLNVRVGNVQIQVLYLEDKERMKEVGRRVASGLRRP